MHVTLHYITLRYVTLRRIDLGERAVLPHDAALERGERGGPLGDEAVERDIRLSVERESPDAAPDATHH